MPNLKHPSLLRRQAHIKGARCARRGAVTHPAAGERLAVDSIRPGGR